MRITTATPCLDLPALAAEFNLIPWIAVEENRTLLAVTNDMMRMRNAIPVGFYQEAVGVIRTLGQRILLESLHRPFGCSTRLDDVAAKRDACA